MVMLLLIKVDGLSEEEMNWMEKIKGKGVLFYIKLHNTYHVEIYFETKREIKPMASVSSKAVCCKQWLS